MPYENDADSKYTKTLCLERLEKTTLRVSRRWKCLVSAQFDHHLLGCEQFKTEVRRQLPQAFSPTYMRQRVGLQSATQMFLFVVAL